MRKLCCSSKAMYYPTLPAWPPEGIIPSGGPEGAEPLQSPRTTGRLGYPTNDMNDHQYREQYHERAKYQGLCRRDSLNLIA